MVFETKERGGGVECIFKSKVLVAVKKCKEGLESAKVRMAKLQEDLESAKVRM